MHGIHLHAVEFAYGQTPFLRVPNYQLPNGESLFVHGPSGSGKSTFLNLLAGILTPNKGQVHLGDVCISELSNSARDRWRRDHLGYLFQQFNLISYLSVFVNVLLSCQLSKVRKHHCQQQFGSALQAAQHWLTKLDIAPSLWQQPVQHLSIGQQQRIAAARALMGGPKFIIADEPTSSLDRVRQQQFIDLLFALTSEENTTLIFVSHDLTLADHFSQQISLLDWRL